MLLGLPGTLPQTQERWPAMATLEYWNYLEIREGGEVGSTFHPGVQDSLGALDTGHRLLDWSYRSYCQVQMLQN